jgi:hypothetical protein
MLPLDLLTTTTKQFYEVWNHTNWERVLEDSAKEKNTPCQDDYFDGCCDGCPIEMECSLVQELGQVMHRNRLEEVLRD